MCRRDIAFLCVVWGALLAGLAWALSTQVRWVQEAKPIQVKRPPSESEETGPAQVGATGVIGTVTDETREAMSRAVVAQHSGTGAATPRRGVSLKTLEPGQTDKAHELKR
jgi:hypothetical protein